MPKLLDSYDENYAGFKRDRTKIYLELLNRYKELPDVTLTKKLIKKIKDHKRIHCFTNNQLFWVAQELKI